MQEEVLFHLLGKQVAVTKRMVAYTGLARSCSHPHDRSTRIQQCDYDRHAAVTPTSGSEGFCSSWQCMLKAGISQRD
jgi:hypothetical protein